MINSGRKHSAKRHATSQSLQRVTDGEMQMILGGNGRFPLIPNMNNIQANTPDQ
jgi:hypothetical protein